MADALALDASVFAALGEPTRLRIVEFLRAGPRSVGEIVEALGARQPQVSKHLKVLGASGLVAAEARHRHRIYRLQPEPFAAVGDWVGSFEALWETRLDALGTLLESVAAERWSGAGPSPDAARDES